MVGLSRLGLTISWAASRSGENPSQQYLEQLCPGGLREEGVSPAKPLRLENEEGEVPRGTRIRDKNQASLNRMSPMPDSMGAVQEDGEARPGVHTYIDVLRVHTPACTHTCMHTHLYAHMPVWI